MKLASLLALAPLALSALACSSTSSTSSASSASPQPTATVSPVEPAPTASTEAKAPDGNTTPPAQDTPTETPPAATGAPAGRLAFMTCDPPSRSVKGCTKELKPVCGQVDTGVRCIKAPCPSAEPRTFPNACTACLEPKVTGYFARSCEDINSGKAP